MKAGDQFIKKIKKFPIEPHREQFIEKYLQKIGKEMAAVFLADHCGILLLTNSTLLTDLLVETYQRQDTTFQYLDLESLPWLPKENNHQHISHFPDLSSMDDKNPVKQSLIGLFCSPLRSGIIYPIYFNNAIIGSIILLYEYKIRLFTPYEIDILKQASDHLTYVLDKLVQSKMMNAAIKIFSQIDMYHQLLKLDEAQNKNPDIIAEILKKILDLKSVYIMKKDNIRGNRWYQADIKKNGKIRSESGTFSVSTFEFLLEEVKKDCPDYLDIPIKNKGSINGKLFIDYGKRENDQPFQKVIERIFIGTANALAHLMYT